MKQVPTRFHGVDARGREVRASGGLVMLRMAIAVAAGGVIGALAAALWEPYDLFQMQPLTVLDRSLDEENGQTTKTVAAFDAEDLQGEFWAHMDADPGFAIRSLIARDVDVRLLAALFRVWARKDPDAALNQLASLPLPNRFTIGLELVDFLGSLEEGARRVSAYLPPVESTNFRIEAIARGGVVDHQSALRAIAMFDRVLSVSLQPAPWGARI
jgi:hypothetical protein